jgi:NAD(P)-dependent dehydrogenase (short-subunit alcohol dehydrogenase family)
VHSEAATDATRLDGQVAIVTGTTGIGAATARLLVRRGAHVTVVGLDAGAGEALARELGGGLSIATDLTTPGAARDVVARTRDRLGRLDILVNVAGISGRRFGDGPVHDATDEGWDAVMDTNAKTMFAMCREALGPMRARRSGAIVNVASVLAYSPAAAHFATHAYAASNGARLALTLAMAAAYASDGIRVNAVAPGLIATPMSARAQSSPAVLDYLRQRQPLTGAPGQADDVAEAIAYLASPAARFVTGVVLEVGGGWNVAR